MKTKQQDRYYALDALRGIAALVVAFGFHFLNFIGYEKWNNIWNFLPRIGRSVLNFICSMGHGGVDLFFLISGFIFMAVYYNKLKDKKVSFKDFMFKRYSRLYPLFILTLIFGLAVCIITASLKKLGFFDYFSMIFMFDPRLGFNPPLLNEPAWTLFLEVFAYLLFFFLCTFSKNKKVFILPIMIGLLASIFGKDNLPIFNYSCARLLVGFFLGCYCYELNIKIKTMKPNLRFLLLGLFSCTAFAFVFYSYIVGGKIPNWNMFYDFLVFPEIMLIALNVGWLSRFLSLRLFRWLGDMSYSLYLWHYPLFFLLRHFGLPNAMPNKAFYLLYIFMSLLISHISHNYFEMPTQKWLRTKIKV
ncbi:acyltransferase family protein [Treponema sp. R6D11]